MPIPMPLGPTWLSVANHPAAETRAGRRMTPSLVAAVAAIVAVAAQRARATGSLDALRDAVEAALEGAATPPPDPREAEAADLPRIADADPTQEERRLRALFGRMQPG